jgi:hypothetical protein
VKRHLRGAVRLLALPTVALIAVLAFVPGRLPLAVRAYALGICTVALGIGLIALRRSYPPIAPLRRPTPSDTSRRRPPPTLARMEDELALGVAGSFHLHHRLVPRLRSVAGGLLSSRHRVSLDSDQDDARDLLGDETWDLVRPGRPPPEDRLARGLPAAALERVVGSLERV